MNDARHGGDGTTDDGAKDARRFARRGFLRGAALAGAGLAAGGAAPARAPFGAGGPAPQLPLPGTAPLGGAAPAVPFHGPHQAAVLTPPRRVTAFVAFDVTAEGRRDLADLLRTLTERTRFLTGGGVPDPLGITGPPADSGLLGPQLPSGALSVTVGVGAALFDDRFGLHARAPRRLSTMPAFPDDDLQPDWCHGDLSLQLCADDTDTVLHALRDIARHTRGGMQIKWRVDGFQNAPRPSGTQRNLLGFKDGIANPDVKSGREMERLVWVGDGHGEPAWATGGSYQV
ncbi:Dyp-type peroxidase, partial [Streptomyces noursei]